MKYQTKDLSPLIEQDVLLLAGENDHFVPVEFLELQKAALTSARSVRARLFTAEEGGDQHCQVGRLDLATGEILDWLDSLHKEGRRLESCCTHSIEELKQLQTAD